MSLKKTYHHVPDAVTENSFSSKHREVFNRFYPFAVIAIEPEILLIINMLMHFSRI